MSKEKPEVGFDLSKISLSDLFGQEEDFDILEEEWEDYQEELEAVNSKEFNNASE